VLKLLIAAVLAGLGVLVLPSNLREALMERAKLASDVLMSQLLRQTSQFESELSDDTRSEQEMWREQRRRDLRDLAKEA
jgi:hypothetical protein